MARTAVKPIETLKGVELNIEQQTVRVKGPKGQLEAAFNSEVAMSTKDGSILFTPKSGSKDAIAQCGTARSIVRNMMLGVTEGYERKLALFGVGLRAQAQGNKLNLTLGFSHSVDYEVPEGITVETPSQTEIVVSGFDKQQVGQVAAEIRRFRPPEPYKGKGVRYANERVRIKEAKKK